MDTLVRSFLACFRLTEYDVLPWGLAHRRWQVLPTLDCMLSMYCFPLEAGGPPARAPAPGVGCLRALVPREGLSSVLGVLDREGPQEQPCTGLPDRTPL